MSQVTIVDRSPLVAALTAVGAVGFVLVPAPALADPMLPLPLAPACAQYGWPGAVQLTHTNGWVATFSSKGADATGPASAQHGSVTEKLSGTINGGIKGTDVDFTINWNNGAVGRYTGQVGADGVASGETIDIAHPDNKATWNTTGPLSCIETGPVVPPLPNDPPKSIGKANLMRVNTTTDVFDKPSFQGGQPIVVDGQKVFLTQGSTVTVSPGCNPDDWCEVTVQNAPGGKGFVPGEHLDPT